MAEDKKTYDLIIYAESARRFFLQAIDLAEEGKFEEAEAAIASGKADFQKSHQNHAALVASVEETDHIPDADLLLTHAEDIMTSADILGELAQRFLKLYRRLDQK